MAGSTERRCLLFEYGFHLLEQIKLKFNFQYTVELSLREHHQDQDKCSLNREAIIINHYTAKARVISLNT